MAQTEAICWSRSAYGVPLQPSRGFLVDVSPLVPLKADTRATAIGSSIASDDVQVAQVFFKD